MPRAAAQPPPAPAKVQALDADELPILRAALRSLRDADAKRALQRHTSGPGYVLRKCAAHPALLDAVEDMLGPNIALLDISYFPTSAAAPPVEARTGPRNVYGWVSDDGIFELWSIAFAPSFNGEPRVRFAFGDASTGAASKPGACLLRGATGEEDAADERLAKRLKVAQYRRMDESTEDDLAVQCAVFNMDKRRNQADRVLAMLTQLRGIDVGTKVRPEPAASSQQPGSQAASRSASPSAGNSLGRPLADRVAAPCPCDPPPGAPRRLIQGGPVRALGAERRPGAPRRPR